MSKDRSSLAHSSRFRAPVITLGAFALAIHVGCSDDPQPQPQFPSTGGTSSTAGTGTTAGTPGTSGTFGTSGSTSTAGTAGTFGTGGTSGGAGGTGVTSGGAGGTAGAGTAGTPATAGTGGTGIIVDPPLDCTTAAGKALPVALLGTWGFPDSGDDSFVEAPVDGVCAADAPVGAAGCWSMAWTPVTRTFVHWYWHNTAANWTGPGVCVAPGAKAVTLRAKADGPVTAEFSAAGVKEIVDLTTTWQDVVIDISTVTNYNTLHTGGGVNAGLVVVMAREGTDVAPRKIYWYDVKWVAEAGGGGGEGGAGG